MTGRWGTAGGQVNADRKDTDRIRLGAARDALGRVETTMGEALMNDTPFALLAQRVERLERDVRRWKIAAALVVLGACPILLLGAGPVGTTDQIVTKRLVVVDEAGQRRAELNVTNSVPALYLAGRDGLDRAWLEVAGDAPRLVFRDDKKRQRVVLGGFSLPLDSGVTEFRPTSSLVLITENGKIWRAP
jgi:hypothetical protein